MLRILSPQDVKDIDTACVDSAGIPIATLMENAATSISEIVLVRYPEQRRILVLCGNGNNGGDGFAVARMLSELHTVTVAADVDEEKMSDATRANFLRIKNSLPMLSLREAQSVVNNVDVVIDAVFGVGFRGSLKSTEVDWFSEIRAPFKIAIDVPSGLDALTGSADEFTFCADLTISMEGLKLGMVCDRGRRVSGEVCIATIGAPLDILEMHTTAFALEQSDVRQILPERQRQTSKFDYGHVLVIAGSASMRGAAALTSHAALRAGAGLVELVTPSIHPLIPREVIATEAPATSEGTFSLQALDILRAKIQRATAIAVGPGIGDNRESLELLVDVLNGVNERVPIVIDADGLRIVNKITTTLKHCVLTPHHREFEYVVERKGRLSGSTCLERITASRDLAQQRKCIVHLKSHPSITTDGAKTYLTLGGNPGMATAGSGDVLTGIIAGLCAQHVPLLQAAALGAYIHAAAGDAAIRNRAPESIIAGDIVESIGDVIPS
ncbi:MAG: NAD(P)H-hydrate dehydratase [Ignavibacteria bacterium]|nr:NAD(P)H-hydrate dehydratase [Ignavibacteria bacterium]